MQVAKLLLGLGLLIVPVMAEDQPVYSFGTTVVEAGGLQGRVYLLNPKTRKLPKFRELKPVGSIYTTSLNVWPQNFDEGFPGITKRFEWFGIEYTGRFWVEQAGTFRFSLVSDDGAKLYLDDRVVIDNDDQHRAMGVSGSAELTRGVHDIEVDYFQGPRYTVALVLAVAPPEENWRIFNMKDFQPPNDPDHLEKGSISHIAKMTQ